MNFGQEANFDINNIIYEVLSTIARKFIGENRDLFNTIDKEEFEIFVNYMDSSLWFIDEDIQERFECFF